jgi:MFS family permease
MAPAEAAEDDGYPRRAYAWAVVGILFLTAIISYTDRNVLSLLVDPVEADLGIGDTQISLLLGTAFAVIYGIAGIPLGYLADRVSRRNLIVAGAVIWSGATIFCGLSQSFHQLFVGRIFVGLGEAVLSPAAISLISDYFPPSRRGTAVGVFLSGIAVGIGSSLLIGGGVLHVVALGLLSGTAVADLAPWRLVLLMIGVPGGLWGLVILTIREPRRRADLRPVESDAGSPELPPVGWLRIAPIFFTIAMASLVDNAVGAWAPTLLIRQFGADPKQVGIVLGLLLMAGFGGGVLAGGILADRAGAAGGWARKVRLCLLAALVIPVVALLMNAGSFAVVLIGVPLYFAVSGIVTACGFSAILDVVPNRSRGLAMSVAFFLNVALGAGLGPTAVAVAGDHLFGQGAGLGPPLSFTMIVAYLAVATAVALTLRRARRIAPFPA